MIDIKSRIGPNGKMVFEEGSVSVEGRKKPQKFDTLDGLKQHLRIQIKQRKEQLEELLNSYTDLERAFTPESFTGLMNDFARKAGVRDETKPHGEILFDIDDAGRPLITQVFFHKNKEQFTKWTDGSWAGIDLRKIGLNILADKIERFAEYEPTRSELETTFGKVIDNGANYLANNSRPTAEQLDQPSYAERDIPRKSGQQPKVRRLDASLPDEEMAIKAYQIPESGEAPQSKVFGNTLKSVAIAGVAAVAGAGISAALGNKFDSQIPVNQYEAQWAT